MDRVHFALGMNWIELTTAVGALYLYLLHLSKRRNRKAPSISAGRIAYRARLVGLALALPLEVALGAFLLASDVPLYAHYVALSAPWGGSAAALLSQQKAGWTLLVGGALGVLVPGVFLISKRRPQAEIAVPEQD